MVATPKTDAARAMVFWTELSTPERQVGTAMAEGWTNSTIAGRLALSAKTIERRVSSIYEKLPDVPGVDRRVHAVLLIKSILG